MVIDEAARTIGKSMSIELREPKFIALWWDLAEAAGQVGIMRGLEKASPGIAAVMGYRYEFDD